ncbi:MAG: hypothetical protein A2087_04210 [Spirochaetes bacterium GWD1_61_31]|nr:MAG: hypothetical protein A2Y37_10775 [Spirochaetes bacterium GWB1_60_80]OHD34096.1 MAG: hypothetical protein A2004_05140 [Spirochaetes bacterium GWC1_61_12]OHD35414.1 MAG: hypothetical protein A2087_04210 [Spirochaetes bacterium GWD1_61_31]OHD44922.1 MAG: hypothetical protein A2Y35_12815 [Spirochaetes bacterium GWE1_60_18]OHD60033.1 MAG: hypothetical protein A2Y32_10925 [Spirochaetes bacterium GWF1_60_12]
MLQEPDMLSLPATRSSPSIAWQDESHSLVLKGESYPENSFEFFAPLFSWLKAELPRLEKLTLRVDIPYMNSSSTKCMLDVLDMLAERAATGADIRVEWLYEKGNDRAYELAEEFSEDVSLPFEIKPVHRLDEQP